MTAFCIFLGIILLATLTPATAAALHTGLHTDRIDPAIRAAVIAAAPRRIPWEHIGRRTVALDTGDLRRTCERTARRLAQVRAALHPAPAPTPRRARIAADTARERAHRAAIARDPLAIELHRAPAIYGAIRDLTAAAPAALTRRAAAAAAEAVEMWLTPAPAPAPLALPAPATMLALPAPAAPLALPAPVAMLALPAPRAGRPRRAPEPVAAYMKRVNIK